MHSVLAQLEPNGLLRRMMTRPLEAALNEPLKPLPAAGLELRHRYPDRAGPSHLPVRLLYPDIVVRLT